MMFLQFVMRACVSVCVELSAKFILEGVNEIYSKPTFFKGNK